MTEGNPLDEQKNLSEQPASSVRSLVVEYQGKPMLVAAFTDLDGTVNDETRPEMERKLTIKPAIQAIQALESRGIHVGIITGRSFGEALDYQRALGATGSIICEDGAVIVLPEGYSEQHHAELEKRGLRTTTHAGRVAIVVSRVDTAAIESLITQVTEESGQPMISTVFSPADKIQASVGHPSEEAARLSAERLASAYVVNPTSEQERLLTEHAPATGIRLFGKPLHLIGADAHKGTALQLLHDNAEILFPDKHVHGILPIAFGNNINDLELMAQAHALGGISVLVGHPSSDFFVPQSFIPDYVIQPRQAYGHGMQVAVPRIFAELNQRFNLSLQ